MEFISEITDFICLTLFILGFIGNLLGIVVFSSRRFRCCSTYASLALSSFVINLVCTTRYSFLLYSQSRRWLSENLIGTSWLACKIFRFTSSFRVLAAWVTVFWVIERFIYVTARLHVVRSEQYQCARIKKFRYVLLVFIATIMFLIVTGPTVLFFSPNLNRLNDTVSKLRCIYNEQTVSKFWQDYFDNYSFGLNYHTIRCLFSELIPSLLVGIFNIGIIACIICRTFQVRRKHQFNNRNQLLTTMLSGSVTKTRMDPIDRQTSTVQSQLTSKNSSTNSHAICKMSWMNIVLLLHSLLFFLSSSVASLVYFSTLDSILAHWVSHVILANCSLNFYVYCLSGRQFRRELRRIALRYARHIRKALSRKSHPPNDRHLSPAPRTKNIYQPVELIKQRHGFRTPLTRSSPVY